MISKIADTLKKHWKVIVFTLAPLLIIAIIFALPLKTVPVQATEKYWATETQQQPYTVTETYVDQEPYTATEIKRETIYNDTTYTANWTRTFTLDKPQSTVTVSIQNYGSYSYPPVWYTPSTDPDGHIMRFFPYDYWWGNNGQAKITIDVSYPQEITKTRSVTKTRDVVKYRDVQVQVQKERSVTNYVKKSLWAYLFD